MIIINTGVILSLKKSIKTVSKRTKLTKKQYCKQTKKTFNEEIIWKKTQIIQEQIKATYLIKNFSYLLILIKLEKHKQPF